MPISLAGPRGTGKTTTARILAKCLNCESGPTIEPCGKCERCLGAEAGTEVDIIELDAASHTGVDTIRDLRDEAAYAPMRARHKVYIIDEVHMLSKGAFNALLKTLEEPPPHVVFLFATTEPHKVLDTILSRCQVLRLSPLSEEAIVSRLDEVFRLEGIEAEDGVTREIARGARGGMRDALSTADKLLALAGSRPQLADLERLGGEGGSREIRALLERVESADPTGLLTELGSFQGDETELLAGLLEVLRTAVVLAYCGAETPLVSATPEERQAGLERAERLGPERLELWMQELLRARERMRLLPGQERLILEITLLDLTREATSLPLGELVSRLSALEGRLGGAPDEVAPSPGSASARAPRPPASPRDSAPGDSAPDAGGLWTSFVDALRERYGALAEMLERRGSAAALEVDGSRAVLRLDGLDGADAKLFADRRNRSACASRLSALIGRELELRFEPADGTALPRASQPAPSDEAGRANSEPAEAANTERQGKKSGERSAPRGDAFTNQVADLFGGVVEDLS